MTTLSTSTPATTPHPNRIVAAIKGFVLVVVAFWRARAHRREVTDLLRLDDRMLKDIGLVRTDILGALAEPAAADPSVALRLRSVENRLNQRERQARIGLLKLGPTMRPAGLEAERPLRTAA